MLADFKYIGLYLTFVAFLLPGFIILDFICSTRCSFQPVCLLLVIMLLAPVEMEAVESPFKEAGSISRRR